MHRTLISEITPNEQVKIQGFVDTVRNRKTMAFFVLRDLSGRVQVTVDKGCAPHLAEVVDRLTVESAITVVGRAAENASVKLGGRELLAESIEIAAIAEPLPLVKDSGIETRLDYRWLDLRTERNQLIFKVQTLLADALRRFLLERAFLEIHTPKLISAASESGSEVFALQYFDRKAYLSQSPQFYKQMAMAAGLERIFEMGPVFRAEKSHTRRHATEFTGFDVELSWIDSYRDLMALEESLLAQALAEIQAAYGPEIERLTGLTVRVPSLPFPVIRLEALYRELESRYGYAPPEGEHGDLTTEAEGLACRYAEEAYGHEFLFVTDFAARKRAFYHLREEGVPQGYDLLWRGVEITTGAQREHRHAILTAQAQEAGLHEDVQFYTEFFRYGCPPHGGFGLGLDRLTMLLMDLSIKEAMFLFRGPNRLTP